MNDQQNQNGTLNPAAAIGQSIAFLCAIGSDANEDSDLRNRALSAAQSLEKVQNILRKRELQKLRASVSQPRGA
jgi:hypothetical protein